jgi:methylmalonyl-CoA/ethylmalonyl-CoA epimerase
MVSNDRAPRLRSNAGRATANLATAGPADTARSSHPGVSQGDAGLAGRAEGAGALRAIDHVGIAVRDLDAAVALYENAFGAEVVHRETVEHDGVEEVLLAAGGSFIQLLCPTRPDSPVATSLERRGEGLHHVAYRVESCAAALGAARAAGIEVIDEEPRPGSRGTSVAFLHPRSCLGTLVELVEEAPEGLQQLSQDR